MSTRSVRNNLQQVLIVTLLLSPLSLSAHEHFCPKEQLKSTVYQAIPEQAFTKARASEAFDTIAKLNKDGRLITDYVKAENDLLYLEGYLLKSHIDSENDIVLKEFCSFLKTEAYLRH